MRVKILLGVAVLCALVALVPAPGPGFESWSCTGCTYVNKLKMAEAAKAAQAAKEVAEKPGKFASALNAGMTK